MNNRVLILGCGGMLGIGLYNELIKNNYIVFASDIDVNEKWLTYLDVRDFDAVYAIAKSFKPTIIINLAAITDLELCEKNEELASSTNFLGVKITTDIANKLGTLHIYISTAGIFDGKKQTYTEEDIPNPLSIYGKTKYAGEKYALSNANRGYVFRAGWMMGGFEKDKKFIRKILQKIKTTETIYAVNDKFGAPTYTIDFSRNILHVINKQIPFGLYNAVCSGNTSRFEIAKKIIEILSLPINVIACNSSVFEKEYFAPRPTSEILICEQLRMNNAYIMRNWSVCLEEYLIEYMKREKQ